MDEVESEKDCSICMQSMETNSCFPLECGHEFHGHCIMTWFRSGHDQCPLCRSEGCYLYRFSTLRDRYRLLRSRSRNKSAPQQLKKMVAGLQKTEAQLKEVRRELRDHNNKFRDAFRKQRRLCSKVHQTLFKIEQQKNRIGLSEFSGVCVGSDILKVRRS